MQVLNQLLIPCLTPLVFDRVVEGAASGSVFIIFVPYVSYHENETTGVTQGFGELSSIIILRRYRHQHRRMIIH